MEMAKMSFKAVYAESTTGESIPGVAKSVFCLVDFGDKVSVYHVPTGLAFCNFPTKKIAGEIMRDWWKSATREEKKKYLNLTYADLLAQLMKNLQPPEFVGNGCRYKDD
jgi:hypothetical protein